MRSSLLPSLENMYIWVEIDSSKQQIYMYGQVVPRLL